MAGRNTQTGEVLEQMILPALRRGGYTFRTHVTVGKRLGQGRHIVDVLAEKDGKQILVSLKWQQVRGTTEQKVPFEVICLVEQMLTGNFHAAFVVLGGEGWKLRDFYTAGGLDALVANAKLVHIVTLENFIANANQGRF